MDKTECFLLRCKHLPKIREIAKNTGISINKYLNNIISSELEVLNAMDSENVGNNDIKKASNRGGDGEGV